MPKTYRAQVAGGAGRASRALRRLREGVELDDGTTAPAQVRQLRPGVLEMTIHEGRKRQVRRMCEAVGHPVDRRSSASRFGPLELGRPRARASTGRLEPGRGRARCARARHPTLRPPMRLFALRGATTVDRNDADAILGATEWLLREIMKRNDLRPRTSSAASSR